MGKLVLVVVVITACSETGLTEDAPGRAGEDAPRAGADGATGDCDQTYQSILTLVATGDRYINTSWYSILSDPRLRANRLVEVVLCDRECVGPACASDCPTGFTCEHIGQRLPEPSCSAVEVTAYADGFAAVYCGSTTRTEYSDPTKPPTETTSRYRRITAYPQ